MEYPPILAPGERRIGFVRTPPRSLEIADDDRVKRRVVSFDPSQVVLEQFATPDLAVSDRGGERGRRSKGRLRHHDLLISAARLNAERDITSAATSR